MSAAVDTTPFANPPRVIRPDLPTLYVYDHCPFCVRVRLALGIKNVKFNLHFLANDDIPTPTKLIGKKISPIFVSACSRVFYVSCSLPAPRQNLAHSKVFPISSLQEFPEDKLVMAELMDIVNLVDGDELFGEKGMIKPTLGRTDLKAWQKLVQTLLRTLQRPRYVATGLLPEFQQLDGRHAFIKNHQLPPYEKPEWKGNEENPEGTCPWMISFVCAPKPWCRIRLR